MIHPASPRPGGRYHDPAENHVDGYTYPMEEHFVNVSASGAVAVVAVFL
jgi:carbonic anhydrase